MKMIKRKREFNIHRIAAPTNVILNVIFTFVVLSCVLPLLLVIIVSITDETTLLQNGYTFFPKKLGFTSYEYIFRRGKAIINAYGISILVSLVGTVCSTLVMALYAYPLSRPNFKFRNGFTMLVFITMLFSGGLVPWYIIYTQMLKIGDTLPVLIMPYLMNAWYVLIMRTFYRSAVPEELLESARMDGAGEFRIFFRIAFPLSTAGLATVGLFSMVTYWNDWYLPLIFIRSQSLYSIQYLLKKMLDDVQFFAQMSNTVAGAAGISAKELPSETIRMAVAIVAVGPIVLAYPFFQRYFVKGLTVGAIKG
ncbi:MAG: carbohydrate ABC transporter permease [Oscillospiraceae bacterium]|jgi:putative aldouronate transport system permease protein|nr:carbohydrate ABC transporter permease [Oscillospiraceae bacterium]